MRVACFDFHLPPELIAQHPVRPRDHARLLVLERDRRLDRRVLDLPDLLQPGDLLVLNDTRVLPVRLVGTRGGAAVEVTLLEPVGAGRWQAFARPARRCHPGEALRFPGELAAEVLARGEGGAVTLAFDLDHDALLAKLHAHGAMPLPPYIRRPRQGDPQDREDYQTMFARREGAVAAPTAALHFTPALMAALAARGVEHAFVTLHVGPGTFLPIKVADTEQHVMHAERFELNEATVAAVARARARGGRIVAVGTTVLRVLESVAGEDGMLTPAAGQTRLFITPGYRFKATDLLLTNFHLPRSTLFMLVCAFAGTSRMRSAYAHAIRRRYRFYSYGDACLLGRSEGG